MSNNLVDPVTNQSVFTFLSEFYRHWSGQTAIEVIFLTIIFILAITGNSMVLAAVIRNCKLRTVTNVFICNLAISDILFVAGIPFIVVTRITQHWMFGEFICKVVTYVQFVSGSCSILTMVMISFERFVCVCLLNKYKMATREITIVLFVVWLISASYPIPVALAQTVKRIETDNESFKFCGIEWSENFHAEVYLGFMASFFFVIPLIVISGFYIQIVRFVQRSVSRTSSPNDQKDKSARIAKKQLRLVKMLSSIVILFVIMWLPFFIISFLGVHSKQITSTQFTATLILALANACQNPLIYGYFNLRFREEFRKMCCTRCTGSSSTTASAYAVYGIELDSAVKSSTTC